MEPNQPLNPEETKVVDTEVITDPAPVQETVFTETKTETKKGFLSHLNALKAPKQQYAEAVKQSEQEKPKEAEKTETSTGEQKAKPTEPAEPKSLKDKRERTANVAAKTFDFIIAGGASIFFNLESNNVKASPGETEDLKKEWYDFLEEYPEFQLPPWLSLLIGMVVIYGLKIKTQITAQKFLEAERKKAEAAKKMTDEPQYSTAAHEAFKAKQAAQTEPTKTTEPVQKAEPISLKPCALPSCSKMTSKPKYCSNTCSAKHNTQKRHEAKLRREAGI